AEVIRTYPVAANNRTSTAARLQEVFGDRIRVAADPDGARLIVVAPPEIQEQIAGYLSEMAVPPAPLPPPTRQPSPFPTAGSPAGRADEAAPQDPLHDLRFRLSTLKASPGTISPAQLAFPEDAVTGGPSPAITGAARPT